MYDTYHLYHARLYTHVNTPTRNNHACTSGYTTWVEVDCAGVPDFTHTYMYVHTVIHAFHTQQSCSHLWASRRSVLR